jgi:predicted transcriptional regulator
MPVAVNHLEEVAFLARSKNRIAVLTELNDDGPLRRRTLLERANCDRTTLQRNLDALVERGWVAESNRTYRITPAGQLVTTGISECLETTAAATELEPFLRWMPEGALGFDIERLVGAETTVNDATNPDRVVCRHTETLRTADRFRGFIPFVGRHSLETVWRRVTSDDGAFEVVVPEASVDGVESEPRYARMFDELRESDRIDVLATSDDIPYYLGIVDGVVQIGNTTDDGSRRAMIETDDDAVRRWAEDTYREHRRRASLLNSGTRGDPEHAS